MVTKHPNLLERRSVGRPTKYTTSIAWLGAGIRRQGWVNLIIATIVGWSGVWVVLWIAVIAGILGAISGVVDIYSNASGVTQSILGQSSVVLAMALGGAGGLIAGFAGALLYLILASPASFIVTIAGGALFSIGIVVYLVVAERWILRLHGYRRLSRREQKRVIPLVNSIGKLRWTPETGQKAKLSSMNEKEFKDERKAEQIQAGVQG